MLISEGSARTSSGMPTAATSTIPLESLRRPQAICSTCLSRRWICCPTGRCKSWTPRAKIEESSLPAALVRYLAEHPHIRRVVLRLDNDATGRIAAETIKTLLPRKYAVTVDIQPPPQGKDYNDCLCMQLGLPITKRRERSKER